MQTQLDMRPDIPERFEDQRHLEKETDIGRCRIVSDLVLVNNSPWPFHAVQT